MLVLRLGPLLGAVMLMVGINYAKPTEPRPKHTPAQRVEFDMVNFRDDFCFDCIDLCADPKTKVCGRRYYVKLVQRAVAKFPSNRVSSQCPSLCTRELVENMPTMIWRSLYSLVRSLPESDPARSDLPLIQDYAMSRVREHQCYPEDRGYRKRDPPRPPKLGGDHQCRMPEPTSELPRPNSRPAEFGVAENEDEPPQLLMKSVESLRGAADEKLQGLISLLGAAARKSFGAHPVNVPIQRGLAAP